MGIYLRNQVLKDVIVTRQELLRSKNVQIFCTFGYFSNKNKSLYNERNTLYYTHRSNMKK